VARSAYTSICNQQSETGNPPEGWESEGQIINHHKVGDMQAEKVWRGKS